MLLQKNILTNVIITLLKRNNYIIVKDANQSDIIILNSASSLKNSTKKENIFVLKYNLLNRFPQSFGAFFWKKGRPNIVFIKPRVKRLHLKLSNDLKEYEEEKVW